MSTNYFKSALVGAFIASTLIQLAACQSSNDEKGTKGVPVGGKVGAPTDTTGKQKVDPFAPEGSTTSAQTPEQKEEAFIKLSMSLLDRGDQLLSEGWKVATRNREATIETVFARTLQKMKEAAALKPGVQSNNCTSDAKDLTPVFEKTKDSNSVLTKLMLRLQDCNKKNVDALAYFKVTTKNTIQIVFNSKSKHLFEVGGARAAALLKQNSKNEYNNMGCSVTFDDALSIKMFSCMHLGQALNTGEYLEFDTFLYQAKANPLLIMKAKTYGKDLLTEKPNACVRDIKVPLEPGAKISYLDKCKEKQAFTLPKNSPLYQPEKSLGDTKAGGDETKKETETAGTDASKEFNTSEKEKTSSKDDAAAKGEEPATQEDSGTQQNDDTQNLPAPETKPTTDATGDNSESPIAADSNLDPK